ncbi:MAG TPA: TIGR03936 family radical SAM-associated protein [Acidobacteriota bacterium]
MSYVENVTEYDKNFRYRAAYRKWGDLRSLTHLDLTRMLRRAFLQAGIAVTVSGKNPQPQISFGPALPANVESKGEFVDFFTHRYSSPVEILKRINSVLPSDLYFLDVLPVSKLAPSLSAQINGADYSIDLSLPENSAALRSYTANHGIEVENAQDNAIRNFLAKKEILFTKYKTRKIINMKDFVRSVTHDPSHSVVTIEMDIVEGITVGIHQVVSALYETSAELRVCRERLYIWDGVRKKSPLTFEWEQIQEQRHIMDLAQ